MKLSLETVARTWAAGRNVISSLALAGTGIGLVTAAQNKSISDGLDEIASGAMQMLHGATSIYHVGAIIAGPIITIASVWFAQRSAKTANTVAVATAIAKDPTDPGNETAKVALSNAATEVPGAKRLVNPEMADHPHTNSKVVSS